MMQDQSEPKHHALDAIPAGAAFLGVIGRTGTVGGRAATCLALNPARRSGRLGVDFGDQPTFMLLPDVLRCGSVEVDVLARLLPDAPDYSRGFIGLAYRVQPDAAAFECAYLRPTNGRGLSPPPPRDARAVQVFAYPDWLFDRLRETRPGAFEAGADIAPDRWHRLRVSFDAQGCVVSVDGTEVLRIAQGLVPATFGQIGLWVDIGTEGWFSNLRITAQGEQP